MNCSNGQNLIALNSVMSNDYTLLIADVCKRWAPLKCTICHALNCSLQIVNANKYSIYYQLGQVACKSQFKLKLSIKGRFFRKYMNFEVILRQRMDLNAIWGL